MEEINIDDLQRRMEGAIASLTKDFQGLRTGRANSQLLDGIMVEVYGATMPINQVATVSVPEPRMLSVQVWDKDNVKLVEKSVRESDLGLNPQLDGQLLRIPLPDLSEERRIELSKIAAKYAENAKIAVRNVRRDALTAMKNLEKEGELTKDDISDSEKDIQDITTKFIDQVDSSLASKEKDLLTI